MGLFRRKKKVQLYIRSPTNTTEAFVTAFQRKFKCKVVNTECKPNRPLIALCQLANRIKYDIDMALKGIPDTHHSEYVVIIIHKGHAEDLPWISSARQLDIAKNVIELIVMGIDDDGVIYDCAVNRNAKKQLKAYISSFKSKKSKP